MSTTPLAVSRLSAQDLHLFNEGTHTRLWERLGAHPATLDGEAGTVFAVWAPSAESVSVIGDFNGWEAAAQPLAPRGHSGIWEGFAPGVGDGALYKYRIQPPRGGEALEKADPFARRTEAPPRTASVVWGLAYDWGDDAWMRDQRARNALDAPMAAYEVHLGSWMRDADDAPLGYREIAPRLAAYATQLGFTHVELLPVMEHPFYGSWGYQTTGYFAPTARYGLPQDLMFLIDHLHQEGIGVILDWVPSHFPTDAHGLARFDGTHLYEHADPRQGFHPDWQSAIFNYGRHEVRGFLTSSAEFWLGVYHADGLRVDAVASMLYLDYSRQAGGWVPNEYGGRENLEAMSFLRRLNESVYADHPDIQTVAEESTAWPAVSRPTSTGGLGFGFKWDMGWMHDTLLHLSRDPIHRRYHHNELTFRAIYAFTENFVLPLSHDEVVHGKGSLLGRMPGDTWQRFANLRLLFALQYAQPGKKLLFMGGEWGMWREWSHERSLDWHLVEHEPHAGVRRLVTDLNRLHAEVPALHELDVWPEGFEWVDPSAAEAGLLSFVRFDRPHADAVLCAFNTTPLPRENVRLGVPQPGRWDEVMNTDSEHYGGSGTGNLGGMDSTPVPAQGRYHSLNLTVPPLGAVFLRRRPEDV
jgi:1,4-alpha-glucan branching enzyme